MAAASDPPRREPKSTTDLPTHVAIIMDGNGRWAKERGLPRRAGHKAGTENIRRIIEFLGDRGVPYLTLYAFSTENWRRPRAEVNTLMRLLGNVIKREIRELHERGARLLHLGSLDRLPPRLRQQVLDAVELTKDNRRITVAVAFDYGGRAEIVDAVRRIVAEGLPPEEISEEGLGSYLYTAGLPDPDLIIRTAGEMRLSNFLIWQAAYAEYYSTPIYWPDFGPEEMERALQAYSRRERRFGAVTPKRRGPGIQEGGGGC
jgi:undecaprenyl diphosphate synthase